MQNLDVIAIDTETDLISPGRLAPPITCASFAGAFSGKSMVAGLPEGVKDTINYKLLEPLYLLVGHNIAYDMAVIMAEWPDLIPAVFGAYDADRVTDTMIRQRLLDIANGCLEGQWVKGKYVKYTYSLAALVKRYFDRELDKDEEIRLKYGALRNVPVAQWPERFRKYACDDAVATLEVYHRQEEHLHPTLVDQFNQARGALALHLTPCWGMVTDEKAIERLEAATLHDYARAKKLMTRIGFVRAKGTRDTKLVKSYMESYCKRKGITPKTTASGAISLDEEACLASGSRILKRYAEMASLMTVVESHIPALRRGLIAPLQPRFESLVDTGRTSCKGHDSKNPNPSTYGYQTQNIRRFPGIRECFVPRPGCVFIEADYSGLELHTWAQVCIWTVGHSKLADALNAGQDPHLILAAKLLNISYEGALGRYLNGDEEVIEARQFAKVGNFGFQGGMGETTFQTWARVAYGKNFTLQFIKFLRQSWFAAWTEARPYFNYVTAQLDAGGGQATVSHFLSNRVRGPLRFTQCANTFFQGLGADAAKDALYNVVKETYLGRMRGSHVVNFVHDSITTEAPEAVAAEHAEIQAEIMVNRAHTWLPDVKPKVDYYLCRRLSKKAKAIRDENGRLVPWDWEHSK